MFGLLLKCMLTCNVIFVCLSVCTLPTGEMFIRTVVVFSWAFWWQHFTIITELQLAGAANGHTVPLIGQNRSNHVTAVHALSLAALSLKVSERGA